MDLIPLERRKSGGQTNHRNNKMNKELDLVMARRLEDFKGAVSEPYWKRVARDQPPKVAATDLLRVKKKAAALGKDFQILLQAHERQEKLATDLREKVRQLRHDAETKEKQIALAYRTIERLAVDKNNLEATSAEDKTYIRKMEGRLIALKGVSELENQCNEQEGELQNLRVQLLEAEERAAASQELAARHEMDLTFMRRGIELAAEQLTRASGAEVSSHMLLAVAKGQEEAQSLTAQMGQIRDHNTQLTAALEAARSHLRAQHDALLQWQEADTTLRGQVADLEAALQNECAVNARLRAQVELAAAERSAREDLIQELELERTKRVDLESMVERLLNMGRERQAELKAARAELQRMKDEQRSGITPSSSNRRGAARQTTSLETPPSNVLGTVRDSNASTRRNHQQQHVVAFGRKTPVASSANNNRSRRQKESNNDNPTAAARSQDPRSSLDDHIAFLENQLADMSSAAAVAHLQQSARAGGGRLKEHRNKTTMPIHEEEEEYEQDNMAFDEVELSPVRSSTRLSSPERVGGGYPARYTSRDNNNDYDPVLADGLPAAHIWHTNPLADSPNDGQPAVVPRDEDNNGEDAVTAIDVQPVMPHQQQQDNNNVQRSLEMSSITGNEDQAWELLQDRLDQQRSMDHRANTLWQPQPQGIEGIDQSMVLNNTNNAIEVAGFSVGEQQQEHQRQAAKLMRASDLDSGFKSRRQRRQQTQGATMTTNGGKASVRDRPVINVHAVAATGDNTTAYDTLRSPALSAALNSNLRNVEADWLAEGEPDIEQLEVKSAVKANRRPPGQARQTLFDLANMEFDL